MREFIVLTPIDHEGRHHAIGDSILLDDAIAGPLVATAAISVPEVAAERLAETLRGSDYLPTLIRLTEDLTLKQAEVVERAFSASGLDRAAWNGLPDDDRELRIVGSLELLRAQHADPVLGERGLGSLVAAAEGRRVAADNAAEDPLARAAEAVVIEHAGGAAPVEAGPLTTAPVIEGEATTAVVVDPVAAVMPEVAEDSANRRRRS